MQVTSLANMKSCAHMYLQEGYVVPTCIFRKVTLCPHVSSGRLRCVHMSLKGGYVVSTCLFKEVTLCPHVSSGRLNPFPPFPLFNPIISTLTRRLKCHLYASCFAVINSPTCPNESSCIVIKNTKLSLGFHCCISIQSFFFLFVIIMT